MLVAVRKARPNFSLVASRAVSNPYVSQRLALFRNSLEQNNSLEQINSLSFPGGFRAVSSFTTEASTDHSAAAKTHEHETFNPQNPKLELQAHLIADAKADTRHFLDEQAFNLPVQSEVSTQARAALDKWQGEASHTLPHPVWTSDAVYSIKVTHLRPQVFVDRLAYVLVKCLRSCFDVFSGYALGRIDERGWLNRIAYLETVAGVPGMVGAMIRHLNSLRRMERDYGWIHTLLEEAENERMHLMTALVLKKPSYMFRVGVLLTQGSFLIFFTISYLLSRRFAHRFVGYLEEEAVVTYTKLLKEIDHGHLPMFESLPAPLVARDYWCLAPDATFRDVVLAIRADEAHHREVNHTFAEMDVNETNPFPPGH